MSQLEEIRKYAELLSSAAKWSNSKQQILDIESIKEGDKKREYIYEFYCFLRVIQDLTKNYRIEKVKGGSKDLFPKGPGSKSNFPYFVARSKETDEIVFEICTSIDIKGRAGETNAPDISFLYPMEDNDAEPSHEQVIMLFDAKFKHSLSTNVHESEFNKVHAMVINLNTENASELDIVKFDELKDLIGNCLLTNSTAFKTNVGHHKLFNIKEVENFDVGKTFNVIG